MSVPAYEVEIKGLEEQIKRLNAYDANSTQELTTAMNQSVVTLSNAIVNSPFMPVYRGRLKGSIASEVKQEGVGSIVGKVGSTLKSEEYPAVMEFGRKPGAAFPPLEPLMRWVHLVLGVPNEEAKGVAYVVGRSIARKGIKGRRFMQKGFEASKAQIVDYFEQALKRITDALENK
jgi:hypothetical protein